MSVGMASDYMKEVKDFAQEYYLNLLKEVVSPPRAALCDLGPQVFTFGGKPGFREDWTCRNDRGEDLAVSVWHGEMPCRGVARSHGPGSSLTSMVECSSRK